VATTSTTTDTLSVPRPPRRRTVANYLALTKPRIIELLLVTTVPTMIVAEQGMPSLWLIACTVLGGTLAAGGANAMNMVVDRDIDRLMERTKNRPLVTGAMSPRSALTFAICLEVVAFVFLWATVNLLSAVLAVTACLFYVFVYTLWLKRTSTRNIVIGGAAGAVPTLIGWSSVTGTLDWAPVVLFAIIFYWTPPHFWALAIRYRDDYAAAEVPMLPVVESLHRTSVRIVGYTLLLWALTLLFWPVAGMGHLYLGAHVVRPAAAPHAGPRAPGGAGRRLGAPDEGRRHAPVHVVDHLHHPAVRGHRGRPAPALRVVTLTAYREGPQVRRGWGFVTRFPRATRPLLQVLA
jgi:protoheme IX farnesyltransferase